MSRTPRNRNDYDELADRLDDLVRKLVRTYNRVNTKAAVEIIKVLRVKSSGPYTYEMLADMGHPYGIRYGARVATTIISGNTKLVTFAQGSMPNGTPAIINKQSGQFYESWTHEVIPGKYGLQARNVFNYAPYAHDLEFGIPNLTIPRPILIYAQAWMDKNYAKLMYDEVSTTMRRWIAGT